METHAKTKQFTSSIIIVGGCDVAVDDNFVKLVNL